MKCRIGEDRYLIIVPQDKGEPPNWVPVREIDEVHWVDRDTFNYLKTNRHNQPCDKCPIPVKDKCSTFSDTQGKDAVQLVKEAREARSDKQIEILCSEESDRERVIK